MAALAAGNASEHVAEIKALRREHREDFEVLGPKVSEATAANPTRLRIRRTAPADLAVVVTLPAAYPSDASPLFAAEGPRGSKRVAAAAARFVATPQVVVGLGRAEGNGSRHRRGTSTTPRRNRTGVHGSRGVGLLVGRSVDRSRRRCGCHVDILRSAGSL